MYSVHLPTYNRYCTCTVYMYFHYNRYVYSVHVSSLYIHTCTVYMYLHYNRYMYSVHVSTLFCFTLYREKKRRHSDNTDSSSEDTAISDSDASSLSSDSTSQEDRKSEY